MGKDGICPPIKGQMRVPPTLAARRGSCSLEFLASVMRCAQTLLSLTLRKCLQKPFSSKIPCS